MYKDMAAILEDREIGDFKLESFEITERERGYRCDIPVGKYVRIIEGRSCVMSNTPMERDTNAHFVNHAHGDVLIAGLGIGLILLAIQDKENVRSITVIEKNKEIIEMIKPQLPLNNKVIVIQADIFEWKPGKGTKYDVIYFDIWNYINSAIYREMVALKQRFKGRLRSQKENPKRFMSCWAERQAKNNIRI